MIESNEVILEVKDLFEELKDENNRLLNELKLTENLFNLFENYRKLLIEFTINCKCIQNIESNQVFSELELQYKRVFNEFNNRIEVKSRPELRPILQSINKNQRKCKTNNNKTNNYRIESITEGP